MRKSRKYFPEKTLFNKQTSYKLIDFTNVKCPTNLFDTFGPFICALKTMKPTLRAL